MKRIIGRLALLGFAMCGLLVALPAADTAVQNIIKNGGFDAGTGDWVFQLNGGGAGGKAAVAIDQGAVRVSEISDGGTQVYSIQLIQSPITVAKGVKYRLQFDAKAAAKRPINVKIGGVEARSWADYTKNGNGAPFTLDTEMKTYTYEFEMLEATDKAARIEFSLGMDKNAVWLDNVVFGPLATAGLVRDGTLKNGDFAKDESYWDVWSSDADWSGKGEMKLKVDAGELQVAVSKVGGVSSNPKLTQTGLVFEKGKSYQVSFYARSDKNRAIQVSVGTDLVNAPFYAAYTPPQVFQLGAANQPYTFSFVMRADPPEDGRGKLFFEFGTIEGKAVPATVTLSRIELKELDKAVVEFVEPVEGEQIGNGHFELDAKGWQASGGVTLGVERESLKLSLPAAAKAAAAKLSWPGLRLAKGEGYLLSFVAQADAKRSLSVALGGTKANKLPAAASSITLGPKAQQFQYWFSAAEAADAASLEFDLAKAAAGAAGKATVWIDKVSLRSAGAWMDSAKPTAERVRLLMAEMSLSEKAGQMVQAERAAVKPGNIREYGIGSILSGGGSVPASNTTSGWIALFNRFQAEALGARLSIPILYGIDAVHGHGNVYGATIFPHNIGLGATRNPKLVEQIGAITAREVAATGLNWTFGPCVAVSRDERWGRVYESFGETPELQTLLSGAFVLGLQGAPGSAEWLKGSHIIGSAKHFLGDGGAEFGTGEGNYIVDRGDIKTLSLEQLKAIHAQGYVESIKQGIATVMASFNMYQGQHMHANKALLTDYLKAPASQGGLGFEGFVIGDWDAVSLLTEVGGDYAKKIVAAFNAGLDMSMEQSRWQTVIKVIEEATADGRIPESRVDDAVRRILTVKFNAGVFDRPWALDTYSETLGSAEHRAVAAQAVKESAVLLKNQNEILPLKPKAKIFVSGPLADNVGWQCGGWTIQWQGAGDRGGQRLTPGTSILDGLKAQAKLSGGEIITDPARAKECSAAVVVVGETPYAEGVGDVSGYGSMTLDDSGKLAPGNLEAIQAAKDAKLPLVVVLVSGRPLVVTKEIDGWDAFVAAWLPGSEGGALAELLYGKENFKGKLPLTWPSSVDQLPINVGDADYEAKKPLFKYGYGLSMKLK